MKKNHEDSTRLLSCSSNKNETENQRVFARLLSQKTLQKISGGASGGTVCTGTTVGDKTQVDCVYS